MGTLAVADCGYQHLTRDTAVDVCVSGFSDKFRDVSIYNDVDGDGDLEQTGSETQHKWIIHTDQGVFSNESA